MKNENIYMLTDGCAWEINKQMGNEHPHSVEVVDVKTGAVRYIKSGSCIKLVEGQITDIRTQKKYNEATSKIVSDKRESMSQGKGSKGVGKK